MEDTETQTESQQIELLSFHVGESEYSVNIMSVREIRGWTRATPLPHSPEYVRGVINLRGNVLPVIDLAMRLGLPNKEPEERHVIIVVDVNNQTVGLRVDAVSDILTLPTNELQSPPELSADDSQGFIEALTIVEGRMIRILDLPEVMPKIVDTAA